MARHGWATGMAVIGYDWGYRPLCEYVFRVEPWTPTGYGLFMLAMASVVAAFSAMLET